MRLASIAARPWPKIAEALGMTHPGAMKAAKAK
jgi:hypothetical protein